METPTELNSDIQAELSADPGAIRVTPLDIDGLDDLLASLFDVSMVVQKPPIPIYRTPSVSPKMVKREDGLLSTIIMSTKLLCDHRLIP